MKVGTPPAVRIVAPARLDRPRAAAATVTARTAATGSSFEVGRLRATVIMGPAQQAAMRAVVSALVTLLRQTLAERTGKSASGAPAAAAPAMAPQVALPPAATPAGPAPQGNGIGGMPIVSGDGIVLSAQDQARLDAIAAQRQAQVAVTDQERAADPAGAAAYEYFMAHAAWQTETQRDQGLRFKAEKEKGHSVDYSNPYTYYFNNTSEQYEQLSNWTPAADGLFTTGPRGPSTAQDPAATTQPSAPAVAAPPPEAAAAPAQPEVTAPAAQVQLTDGSDGSSVSAPAYEPSPDELRA